MNSKVLNFLFLHVTLLFYSLASVCSKMASKQDFLSFEFFLFYGLVLVILFGYAIVWQQILKKIDLTVAFANKAIVIAWGMLWGIILFHETIKWNMILGGVIIIAGIFLVVSESE